MRLHIEILPFEGADEGGGGTQVPAGIPADLFAIQWLPLLLQAGDWISCSRSE